MKVYKKTRYIVTGTDMQCHGTMAWFGNNQLRHKGKIFATFAKCGTLAHALRQYKRSKIRESGKFGKPFSQIEKYSLTRGRLGRVVIIAHRYNIDGYDDIYN